jgi:hypothetical protein
VIQPATATIHFFEMDAGGGAAANVGIDTAGAVQFSLVYMTD